jgi:hypothetical protein
MKHSEIKEMIRRAVQEKKLTAAEKKKKEQIVKGMKKSFKGDKSDMYAIATAKAKKIAEDLDIGHEDDEPGMLKNELMRAAKMAVMLYKKVDAYGKQAEEVDFPQWWQSKIIKAKDYLQGAFDYLDGEEMISQADNTGTIQVEEKDPLDFVVSEDEENDELDYNNVSDLEDELRRLIRWSNQYGSKGADAKIEQLKKRIEYLKKQSIKEKKGKDLTGPSGKPDGKIDSADYLKARDIAIKKAQAKKK